ncbi:transcription factor bHLH92-like [Impatiens glandulifera]|uniref:transcription factor bHLH92-like n=1 Tax=Impatiens glandulifera TaxID=253017 RepID=UPI001FB0801F|nr:transcription factor bHLH92-like [Impatiens glandulifera]
MEEFFQYDFTTPFFPAVRRSSSAFIPYNHRTNLPRLTDGSRINVNRRMVEFLRRTWSSPEPAPAEMEVRERGYKHMINERIRREKQKESYSNLLALLPHGTKNDKNTIVQVAAKEVVEMEKLRREMEDRNKELEERLANYKRSSMTSFSGDEVAGEEYKKIMLKVENLSSSSSGVNYILEVLRYLKNNGFKTKSIQSSFSNNQISALLHILISQDKDWKEAQAAIEAVQQTLIQVERG